MFAECWGRCGVISLRNKKQWLCAGPFAAGGEGRGSKRHGRRLQSFFDTGNMGYNEAAVALMKLQLENP